MIFSQILYKYHKKLTPIPIIPNFHVLYDTLGWKFNDKERREYVNYFNRLPGEYDRFRNASSIKIYSQNYLPAIPEIWKIVKFVSLEVFNEPKELETLKNFLLIYHEENCKDLISKHLKKEWEIKKEESKIEDNKGLNKGVSNEILEGMFSDMKTLVPFVESVELSLKEDKKLLEEDKDKKPKEEENKVIEEPKEEENKVIEEPKEEENKVFEEKEEEKKEEKDEIPKSFSEKEFKFLEKFYFLLEIEKPEFQALSRSQQIKLLDMKYEEYIIRLSDKYNNEKDPIKYLKFERERLAFLMCEKYLNSEEDQYMYNELQELKFFLNSLKKASIDKVIIPNDEMIEKSEDFLQDIDFCLDSEITIDKFINFDIVQFAEKRRYQVFDKEFLEKTDYSVENQPKTMNDFYEPEVELDKIYDFDFFAKTIEIDDELLNKLFELLCYSMPEITNLTSAINVGLTLANLRLRSTFLLLKILSFNYKNFIKIIQLIDFHLDVKNYQDENPDGFITKFPSFADGKKFETNEKFFSMMHCLIAGASLNLIKNNYATNFFILINTNPEKMQIYSQFIKEFGIKRLENYKSSQESIIRKIFAVYIIEPDFSKFIYEFDIVKNFINVLFSRNLDPDQIPSEKLAEIINKNPLTLYPFFQLEEIHDIPDSKVLSEILLKHNNFLQKKKIKVSEWFFRLLTKNSVNFIPILCSKLLPELLKEYNKNIEALTRTLMKNHEKIKEDAKSKPVDFTNMTYAVINVNNNFDSAFPTFKDKIKEFGLFCQNLLKLTRKSLENRAKSIRMAYQKGLKTEKELVNCQQNFEEVEKDLIESLRFFTLKNHEFIMGFLQVLKVFIIVEDIAKLFPQISKYQRYNMFDLYNRVIPALKAFFRVINFIEMKELEQKTRHDIDFLFDHLSLPEMKRIQTKEGSTQINDLDPLTLEKTLSSISRKEEWSFDDVFTLIYKVQDSIQNVMMKIPNGKSPSIYKILFKKTEMNRLNVFLKMEYIKFLIFY